MERLAKEQSLALGGIAERHCRSFHGLHQVRLLDRQCASHGCPVQGQPQFGRNRPLTFAGLIALLLMIIYGKFYGRRIALWIFFKF
jgi:hypothetical protein